MNIIEFRKIYDLAFPYLFKTAYRITYNEEAVEDMCHDAFLKLYEKDMVFPSLEDAKYWLIKVVKNMSLNHVKRKGREQKAYQKALRNEFRHDETGEMHLVRNEAISEVQEALYKLPDHLRVVLVLKEYDEMNYKEIGKMLGIKELNAKVRGYRARQKLIVLLQDVQNAA
jgi:RNA polymerase sigma-70 factor (ECF subfamily)